MTIKCCILLVWSPLLSPNVLMVLLTKWFVHIWPQYLTAFLMAFYEVESVQFVKFFIYVAIFACFLWAVPIIPEVIAFNYTLCLQICFFFLSENNGKTLSSMITDMLRRKFAKNKSDEQSGRVKINGKGRQIFKLRAAHRIRQCASKRQSTERDRIYFTVDAIRCFDNSFYDILIIREHLWNSPRTHLWTSVKPNIPNVLFL